MMVFALSPSVCSLSDGPKDGQGLPDPLAIPESGGKCAYGLFF